MFSICFAGARTQLNERKFEVLVHAFVLLQFVHFQKKYQQVIAGLAESFSLPKELSDGAKRLFDSLWASDKFQFVSVDRKKIIAGETKFWERRFWKLCGSILNCWTLFLKQISGCCLFVVCRTHDLPMLIRFFSDALGCDKDKFNKELKRLVEITGTKVRFDELSCGSASCDNRHWFYCETL